MMSVLEYSNDTGSSVAEILKKCHELGINVNTKDDELSEDDINLINYVNERRIPCFAVMTKVDKVNQSEKAKLEKHLKEVNLYFDKFYTSILKPQSYAPVRGYIEAHI